MTQRFVELRELELGQRFRFYGLPEQTAVLVEKGPGRALIHYDRCREPETRIFETRDKKTGEKLTKTIAVKSENKLEPCALGAEVIPLEFEVAL